MSEALDHACSCPRKINVETRENREPAEEPRGGFVNPRGGFVNPRDDNTWRITDNWQETVPVTANEVDVLEIFFGGLLDELLGDNDER